jgi:hypothetical protein
MKALRASSWAVAPNSEQEMSKHTDQPALRESRRERDQQWWHPERIAEEKEVCLLSPISSASPLFAVRNCSLRPHILDAREHPLWVKKPRRQSYQK